MDRSEGGLGIGLCLVQRLVELHGGTVQASSTVGKGSEFVVRLPAMSRSTPRPASPEPFLASPMSGPLRVLVVDDNVDMAESLAMLLKAAGHEVRTAYDGDKTVQAVLDYRPHAVLLDIGLPGLDGHEVARRIRQQADLQSVILVALTGYGQEADRQASLAAGFNHHLVKPAEFKDVDRILSLISE